MSEADPAAAPGRGRTILRRTVGVFALAAALWSITLTLRSSPAEGPRFAPPTASTAEAEPFVMLDPVDQAATWAFEVGNPSRLLRLDARTGEVATVRQFGPREQVNGLALHPDGTQLAVLWSPDVSAGGVGIALLDLASGDLTMQVEPEAQRFFLDPFWDGDQLLASQVLTLTNTPDWSAVRVDLRAGTVAPIVPDRAASPVRIGGDLYVLRVDGDGNGRTVSRVDAGALVDLVVAEGETTIDHLMATPQAGVVRVAVHLPAEGGVRFGAPAAAHVGPSTWHLIDLVEGTVEPEGLASDTILDAVVTGDGNLVEVTRQGLWSVRSTARRQVARTRALQFVTG